jgi:Ni/Fe-hydrogenase subunit HybB-like protein
LEHGGGLKIPVLETVDGLAVISYYPNVYEWLVGISIVGLVAVLSYCLLRLLAAERLEHC